MQFHQPSGLTSSQEHSSINSSSTSAGSTSNTTRYFGAGPFMGASRNSSNPKAETPDIVSVKEHSQTTGLSPSGTMTFRPLEAKLHKDKDVLDKANMDAYCKIKLGWHRGKTSVVRFTEMNPRWSESVVLKYKGQAHAEIKIKDKNRLKLRKLGKAKISLDQAVLKGRLDQWFPLYRNSEVTGEIHIEIEFHPETV